MTTTTKATAKKSTRKPIKKYTTKKRSAGGSAPQTILNVIATLLTVPAVANKNKMSMKNEVPRTMVAQFATTQGVQGKSTFANALTKLKKEQQIVMQTSSMIEITRKGLASSTPIHDLSAQTNAEYQNKVIHTQHALTGNMLRLVQLLQDGQPQSKKTVCVTQLNMKLNSTWSNMLTKLKKMNIVTFDRETIQLSDAMYPLGRDHDPRPGGEGRLEAQQETQEEEHDNRKEYVFDL